MRLPLATLALAACLTAPALAHDHDWPTDADLSIEDALDIAYSEGLTLVRELQFDDGYWEVEGLDADGREVEFDIHGETGDIR